MTHNIYNLPDLILFKILKDLTYEQIINICVNKKLKTLIYDNQDFWKLKYIRIFKYDKNILDWRNFYYQKTHPIIWEYRLPDLNHIILGKETQPTIVVNHIPNIIDVQIGKNAGFILDVEKKVYSLDFRNFKKLGQDCFRKSLEYQPLDLPPIQQILSGEHTLLLDVYGKVWIIFYIQKSFQIKNIPKITQIFAWNNCNLLLDEDNHIWKFNSFKFTIKKIKSDIKINKIISGPFPLVIDENNQLWEIIGRNIYLFNEVKDKVVDINYELSDLSYLNNDGKLIMLSLDIDDRFFKIGQILNIQSMCGKLLIDRSRSVQKFSYSGIKNISEIKNAIKISNYRDRYWILAEPN